MTLWHLVKEAQLAAMRNDAPAVDLSELRAPVFRRTGPNEAKFIVFHEAADLTEEQVKAALDWKRRYSDTR